jgi:hypothetical protein
VTGRRTRLHKFGRDERAVSPAISSVILTSAVVVLLLVTVVFANNFLSARMAENDFSAMEQFMQTVGLQIDDVAWTNGRTQTIRYASRFGQVNFESLALNYTVYVDKGSGYVFLAQNATGILLFNMPTNRYSVGNNYMQRLVPSSDRSFLQIGTSAPVSHVFVIEKIPMDDGSYIRVVAAPSLRMLNSTITAGGQTKNYYKFYLPVLSSGTSPRYSQSVTLAGGLVSGITESGVTKVKIHVDFPKASLGFDGGFFGFSHLDEEVDVPNGSIIEFYTGGVTVSLGLYM